MQQFIGIDPGLTGALAVLNDRGECHHLWDAPIARVKKKNKLIVAQMALLLREAGEIKLAVIEDVHAMPRQGSVSMFNFGWGLGLWEGLLTALGIPYIKVSPHRWQRDMLGGFRDPQDRRIIAQQMYPEQAPNLGLKKHCGRADALLLARFAARDGIIG